MWQIQILFGPIVWTNTNTWQIQINSHYIGHNNRIWLQNICLIIKLTYEPCRYSHPIVFM